ncbi:Autophagy- protein 2 A, partial [Perkinsus chesapeaki]
MKGSVYSGGWIRTLLEYTGSAITLGDAKFRIGEGIVQLKLKEAAVGDSRLQVLSSLNAPFVVVKGTIKKIRLSVPWKHVFSQRCKIYFEGLEIHFAMLNDVGDMAHAPINSPMEASPRHGTPPEHATRSYMEAVEESHIPEGVEALTRLVQHILINLEVCLSDATVTLHPHGWVDGKLAGAHSDNNLGAPRIWLNAKELLIYSDTQTHHVPDASPRPTDAEEFPEIPDAPIDSKGISLLSMEVFVARDDQVSRLIHTGETPLRFGLRRVVGDSRDGRRSEADEDQIATLEVDVEVESVHINVDHESTLNVMSVLSESLEGEEKSVVEDEEENRMFYSVMETMMPPKPLSAAERTRIFWLEMYRLFDLDSKLEALCSGEDREEEEKKFMLGYAGPRDEESIQ